MAGTFRQAADEGHFKQRWVRWDVLRHVGGLLQRLLLARAPVPHLPARRSRTQGHRRIPESHIGQVGVLRGYRELIKQ